MLKKSKEIVDAKTRAVTERREYNDGTVCIIEQDRNGWTANLFPFYSKKQSKKDEWKRGGRRVANLEPTRAKAADICDEIADRFTDADVEVSSIPKKLPKKGFLVGTVENVYKSADMRQYAISLQYEIIPPKPVELKKMRDKVSRAKKQVISKAKGLGLSSNEIGKLLIEGSTVEHLTNQGIAKKAASDLVKASDKYTSFKLESHTIESEMAFPRKGGVHTDVKNMGGVKCYLNTRLPATHNWEKIPIDMELDESKDTYEFGKKVILRPNDVYEFWGLRCEDPIKSLDGLGAPRMTGVPKSIKGMKWLNKRKVGGVRVNQKVLCRKEDKSKTLGIVGAVRGDWIQLKAEIDKDGNVSEADWIFPSDRCIRADMTKKEMRLAQRAAEEQWWKEVDTLSELIEQFNEHLGGL